MAPGWSEWPRDAAADMDSNAAEGDAGLSCTGHRRKCFKDAPVLDLVTLDVTNKDSRYSIFGKESNFTS